MESRCKIIISNRNLYREVCLPADADVYRVGTTSECDFRLPKELFFTSVRLDFTNNDGVWSVMCSDELYLSEGDTRRLFTTQLGYGQKKMVKYQETDADVFEMEVTYDFDYKKRTFNKKIDLSQTGRVRIGSTNDCNIVVKSYYIHKDYVEMVRNGNDWAIGGYNISYGIFANGNRIQNNYMLKNGDFFSISDVMFYVKDNCLWMDTDDCVVINNLRFAHCNISREYPMFVRNTRVIGGIDKEKISILEPGAIPEKPKDNLLVSMLPSLMMVVLIVVVYGFMSKMSGAGMIIFSVCSMSIGLITSVITYIQGKKNYKKDCEKRISVYKEYISGKEETIIKEREKELRFLKETYYNTEEDLQHILNFDSCLFDRVRDDSDFLEIYLGEGRRKSEKEIDYKPQEKLETGDEITLLPEQVSKKYEYLENAPITVNIKNANAVGVVGTEQQLYDMFKSFVTDVVSRQYYTDVHCYAFLEENVSKYDWLRLVPHFTRGNNMRNIVCDSASKNMIFELLFKELSFRKENPGIGGYNVVFVMNDHGIKSHPISRFIENASELNTVFIFFETRKEKLPLYCSKIVTIESDGTGLLYDAKNKINENRFVYSTVNEDVLRAASQMLAPVFCEEISLEGAMRKNISLYELMGIYSVEDIQLAQRWATSRIYDTMAAPLGIDAKDEIVYLDLHEKFHGPHGLVAGTTGSGKSEILQSYILSAATLFHPYEISFVIIDFKGGGMVNQFKNLPHLNGAITNIDGNEIERSLKSIKAELLKRQECFAAAGVNHIDKYIQLFKEGKVKDALPHLIMIVDEFAELKAEQPDFMKELVSTARIGRSLGVHLILATQKPSGVVDEQIWSNSKFKLCLKVQNAGDSNEVLKTPLAAEIKEPGRAYLQVGNNEIFELFQSAYSGAPAVVDTNEMENEFEICQLNFAGMKEVVYERKLKKQNNTHVQNQLEAIVEYIHKYCENNGIEKLPSICLPSLPQLLTFQNMEYVPHENVVALLGRYDDPDHQLQDAYVMNFTTTNYMIIGSMQTGKTNILQTIIRSLCENYSPEEVNIYALDFGSMLLRNFDGAKQIGGVVCAHEDEKFKSFFRMMEEEKNMRKARMLEVGVSSFAAYKEAGYTDLPQIIIMIDNMTVMRDLFFQDDDLLIGLTREGLAVGISVVIANAGTSGFGYRYLSNFEGRIALFCNDSGEYSSVIDGCRMKINNIPGRMIVLNGKQCYEAQSFLAFEGEKEIERVNAIKTFVTENKERWKGYKKAKRIPEIPETVTVDYMQSNFDTDDMASSSFVGIDFETVQPYIVDWTRNKMLSITGKRDSAKELFARYIVRDAKERFENIQYYIFDSLEGKWSKMREESCTKVYCCDISQSESIIEEIYETLQERQSMTRSGQDISGEPWLMLLIEGQDNLLELSEMDDAMDQMKAIIEKYYEYKVMVVVNDFANEETGFMAPSMIRLIKNNQGIVVFEDISNINAFDVPYSASRKYTKQLDTNDAYIYEDNDIRKIKVVY